MLRYVPPSVVVIAPEGGGLFPALQLAAAASESLHILINIVHIKRECYRTLYVGLARTVPPTNTNFRLTFLLTRLQEALYEDLAV